jgi:hypothetical protein
MKIDRTMPFDLSLMDDGATYTEEEVKDLIDMIDQGNKSSGGVKIVCPKVYGIIGFIRFLKGYYILLISKRKKVGVIGPHKIYTIVDTQYIYIPHAAFEESPVSANEERYKNLFFELDVTRDFYFSYTYDLTHTLQYNMKVDPAHNTKIPGYNGIFVWNHYLLQGVLKLAKKSPSSKCWILPLIHGSYVQSMVDIFGKILQVILISRRSRIFAGTRFLKRGLNEQGYVANDVETEQILYEPNNGHLIHEHFSSFVQHRGSIPLFWAQDSSNNIIPKPPITIQRLDPFYSASILHFVDLMGRYGAPLIIFNLIKSFEKSPREMILREAFGKMIDFINSKIDKPEAKITYIPWDFKKASKKGKIYMQQEMYEICQDAIAKTGYFHSGKYLRSTGLRDERASILGEYHPIGGITYPSDLVGREQRGVLRTNCIDSLDRTNAAQFCMGNAALGHQLYAMGLISSPYLQSDMTISHLLTEMYEISGHQLALQYGGSGLAHTMKSYNQNKTIIDQSKDVWSSIKRFYSNAFTDYEKQNSINLFLGVFRPYCEPVDLWDLETDYQLHMKNPVKGLICNTKWWVEPIYRFESKQPRLTEVAHEDGEKNAKNGIIQFPSLNESQSPNLARLSLKAEPVPQFNENDEANADVTYEEFYQLHKITEFDKILAQPFNNTQRLEAFSRGGTSWRLFSATKSKKKDARPRTEIYEAEDDEKYNDENPLDVYGMDLKNKKQDIMAFINYLQPSKLDEKPQIEKKRMYYKKQYHLTHYANPTIYQKDDYEAQVFYDAYLENTSAYHVQKSQISFYDEICSRCEIPNL